MKAFHASLHHQTQATSTMLQMAAEAPKKHPAALEVASDRFSYQFKNCVRNKQLQYGMTPNPKPAQPNFTPEQKVKVGAQALQSTPDVFKVGSHLVKSQQEWNKASKLEKEVLKKEAKQISTHNPVRFEGDTFYDALSPEDLAKVNRKPLLTPENDSAHLTHSDRFIGTMRGRYEPNPFEVTNTKPLFGRSKPNPLPQPIGYQSSRGWLYDPETTKRLHTIHPDELAKVIDDPKTLKYYRDTYKPDENTSWIPKVRDGVFRNEQQEAMLQQPY